MPFVVIKVIAGDYEGYKIKAGWSVFIFVPSIFSGQSDGVEISRRTVRSYKIITDDQRKSAISGIARGVIGNYFFGNAGLIGGTFSAKNTSDYLIALEFFNGKKSLIDVDDKKHKLLIKHTF